MDKNLTKFIWEFHEKNYTRPSRSRNIIIGDFKELKHKLEAFDKDYLEQLIKNLYSGDFYILKNSFSKTFMEDLKHKTFNHFKNRKSEFYKMLEGTPDFHRKIDLDLGKKYSIKSCKHSFYFYPWNNDPIKIFDGIYNKWRVIKKLMGLNPNEYEKNTPKDGVVDRVQVVQYPSKIGYLEPHTDPHSNQRLILSAYMSKKGVDFDGLGFYLINRENKIQEVEHLIDVGDIGIGYSSIYHGVAPVNVDKLPKWDDMEDGRWFLSLYSNASDEIKNRVTSASTPEKFDDIRLHPSV